MTSIYTVGYYDISSVTIYNADNITFSVLPNSGNSDGYIVKYDSTANPEWTTRISGINSTTINSIILDHSGNVYVTGTYATNPVSFYNADTTLFTTKIATGVNDCFICKYAPSGTGLWAARMSGTASETGNVVSVDSANNVYIAGQFNSTPMTIYNEDDTSFINTLTPVANFDAFIVKYDSTGLVQWGVQIGGVNVDNIKSMTVDHNDDLVIFGYFDSALLTFFNSDGSTFSTLSSVGTNSIFIVKYNSNGFGIWRAVLGDSGSDYSSDIEVDSFGNIYATGYYDSSTFRIYDSLDNLFATTLSNSGNTDSFVVKYSISGLPQWLTRIAGTDPEVATNIAVDSSNQIIVSGYYESNPLSIYNEDATLFNTLANSGVSDIYIVKYDANGDVIWDTRISGLNTEQSGGLDTDLLNNIYIGGYFSSSLLNIYNEDATIGLTLSNISGYSNSFIIKYNKDGIAQWANYIGDTCNVFNTDLIVYDVQPEPEPEPEPEPPCPPRPPFKTIAFRSVQPNMTKKQLYAKASRGIVCR
jgi:Beta-propeller repeat